MQEVSGKDAFGGWTGYNDVPAMVQGVVAKDGWKRGRKGLKE